MSGGVRVNYATAGTPELYSALREIDKKVAKKAMRTAIKTAILPVVKTAVGLVQVQSGTLKKSLGSKIASFKGGAVVVGIGGPRFDKRPKPGKPVKKKRFARKVMVGGKEQERIPTYYAHLVEKGTRPHALGKGSRIQRMDKRKVVLQQHGNRHPGSKAHPFMKPALDRNKSSVKSAIEKILRAAIQAANSKGGKP